MNYFRAAQNDTAIISFGTVWGDELHVLVMQIDWLEHVVWGNKIIKNCCIYQGLTTNLSTTTGLGRIWLHLLPDPRDILTPYY